MGQTSFAVFASGRGSNFLSIYEAMQAGDIQGEITCIISDKSGAPVLSKASELSIPAFHRSPKQFESEESYVEDVAALLAEHHVDYILLAGYLKKIPGALIQRYPNKIVNIHPALLPSFGGKGYYGIRVHEAVIAKGVKYSGVTLHFIDEKYDHGPIIYQYPVRVRDDDSPEDLAGRVLQYEHKAYPRVVRWLCQGWIQVHNQTTTFTGPEEEWEITL